MQFDAYRMTNGPLDSWRSPVCRCFVTSEWNVEGGRQHVDLAGFLALLWFILDVWIDGLDWSSVYSCRVAGEWSDEISPWFLEMLSMCDAGLWNMRPGIKLSML